MDDKRKQLPDLFDQRLNEMVKAVDSFFDESIKQVNQFFQQSSIPVEVIETGTDVTIEAYLPGVQKEQIRIDRFGNQVRIRVENHASKEVTSEDSSFYNKKQAWSQKERIITLPFAVSETSSSASFKNDVLKVMFAKNNSSIKVIDVDN
ncbi:Hsp20/alpha crystallin family protein [Halobacillus litoralis]|uniref:Hsp20/alpha crystallin family protein n=1 Tax=Halobacillus litoralis TaxID=45668 RepID=UPI002493211E|nr:Hsp20/alpha crystallin family protein [Halobacillus litoralis]